MQVIFNASDWSGSFIVGEHRMSKKQNISHFHLNSNKSKTEVIYTVQCFPLYSMLLAIGKTTVDYFSLDVEGSEYKILKTIPWHKVDIKVRTSFDNNKKPFPLFIKFLQKRIVYLKIVCSHFALIFFLSRISSDMGPFKLDEKVSGQTRGPVVNGATLALFCGITNGYEVALWLNKEGQKIMELVVV
jgi:hypothetical protein